MSKRFISLYFASVGLREALIVVWGTVISIFGRTANCRKRLEISVRKFFIDADVFSYTSARGALGALLTAAKIGPGDDVLLSSFTCLAVPTAVIAVGARPIYADIDQHTLNITPDTVIKALTPKVRAVVVQHTLGSVADVQGIIAHVRSRGFLVIEDCALAIGTSKDGRLLGCFGDAAYFSMELSKTISSGWGGVLVVNNKNLASRVGNHYSSLTEPSFARTARMALQTAISAVCYSPRMYILGRYVIALAFMFRLFGRSTPAEEFNGHVADDFIARIGGAQACLGAHQWRRLTNVADSCEENAKRIRSALTHLGYMPLGLYGPGIKTVTNRVPFVVEDRQAVMEWFLAAGVELGAWFDGPLSPLPEAPIFNFRKEDYPKASFIAKHIVNIPCHSRLTAADLDHIERTLAAYASAHPEDLDLQVKLRQDLQPSTTKNAADG